MVACTERTADRAFNFQAGGLDHQAAIALILLNPDPAPMPWAVSSDMKRVGCGHQGARPAALPKVPPCL
jgi:hypothetical protein